MRKEKEGRPPGLLELLSSPPPRKTAPVPPAGVRGGTSRREGDSRRTRGKHASAGDPGTDYFAARAETIFSAISCPTPSISASSWTVASRRPSTE